MAGNFLVRILKEHFQSFVHPDTLHYSTMGVGATGVANDVYNCLLIINLTKSRL